MEQSAPFLSALSLLSANTVAAAAAADLLAGGRVRLSVWPPAFVYIFEDTKYPWSQSSDLSKPLETSAFAYLLIIRAECGMKYKLVCEYYNIEQRHILLYAGTFIVSSV